MSSKAELLALLKFELFDSDYGGMWTADYLTHMLNDAQARFCEDSGFFVDRSTFVIHAANGVQDYVLDPRIIRILDAYVGNSSVSLASLDYVTFREVQPSNLVLSKTVYAYTTEAATGMFTVFPIPTVDTDITLRVQRYALNKIEDTHGSEIPEQFEAALIHWVAYKALTKHDAELADPVKAASHMQIYRNEVSRAKRYLMDIMGTHTQIEVNRSYVW